MRHVSHHLRYLRPETSVTGSIRQIPRSQIINAARALFFRPGLPRITQGFAADYMERGPFFVKNDEYWRKAALAADSKAIGDTLIGDAAAERDRLITRSGITGSHALYKLSYFSGHRRPVDGMHTIPNEVDTTSVCIATSYLIIIAFLDAMSRPPRILNEGLLCFYGYTLMVAWRLLFFFLKVLRKNYLS